MHVLQDGQAEENKKEIKAIKDKINTDHARNVFLVIWQLFALLVLTFGRQYFGNFICLKDSLM